MIRKWDKIKGFDNYFVTDRGEIFSQYSQIKPCSNSSNGYQIVSLCENGRKLTKSVHAIVLETFNGKRPDNFVIHHKDKNPANNDINNLEWISRSAHSKLHPRTKGGKRQHKDILSDNPLRGERVWTSKLNPDKVRKMRELWKDTDYSIGRLSKQFNVSQGTVSKVVNNKSWAHVV